MLGKELNGRYRIGRRLGSGGMAVVFEARDLLLERDVALKVLRTNLSSDNDIVRRFRREARAVARLIHPHIVNIYDIGQEGDLHFIVMEMITGGNLKEKIQKEGPLDPFVAISFMEQLCQALVAAHQNQIIHCDIKPHNILLDQEERIKVTDFGIARALTATTLTYTEGVVGSAHYLSPEQAQGEEVTNRSDIYSAGVVFYEMVTGEVPFSGESPISVAIKHIDEQPLPPTKKRDLPKAVEAIILRAMKKDPKKRYSQASLMLQDLVEAKRQLQTQKVEEKKEEIPLNHTRDRKKKKGKKKKGSLQRLKAINMLLIFTLISSLALVGFYISFRLFMKVPEVEVPSLIGMKQEEALKFMSSIGLSVEIGDLVYSQEYGAGLVTDQYPQEGSVVKQNRAVVIDVSRGTQLIEIPDLLYSTLREASILLTPLRLEIGEVTYTYDEEVPEGKIISQDPLPGQELGDNNRIHLLISQGELPLIVEVPDLNTLTQKEALILLEETGLREGNINLRESLSYRKGIVIGQRPSPGSNVSRGTPVDLIVSSGIKNPQGAPIHEHTVSFPLPSVRRIEITIIVIDDNGERLAYREIHENDTSFTYQVVGVGSTIIRAYLDEHLFLEERIGS